MRENPATLRTTVQQNVVHPDWEIDVVVRRDLAMVSLQRNHPGCASSLRTA
jgi:hypothetical protein